MSNASTVTPNSLTILVPEGLVSQDVLRKVNELVVKFDLQLYISTAQNLRLLNITDENIQPVKDALAEIDAQLKGPGKFPLPRVCVGEKYCSMGIVDTFSLSQKITSAFGSRKNVKPKFKIAVSGCPASCSNVLTTDIGVKSTKAGFDLYVGGKGGPNPQKGMRIARGVDTQALLEKIEQLVDFHDETTGKKQRMSKMIKADNFPFSEV